ncbi:MAG: mechanosensitive ion channel [Anaerolineae bacterium]
MQQLINQLVLTIGNYLPSLVAAVAILVVGWLVALLISAIVRGVLRRTTLDNRIAAWAGLEEDGAKAQTETVLGKAVYYLIMLFVLIAFFEALGLTIITVPLNSLLNGIFNYLPSLLGGAVLAVVAWLIATALKIIVSKGLGAIKLDERLTKDAGLEAGRQPSLSETLADAVYWFVLLLVLPAILGALGMQGLLVPVQGMINDILNYLPNVVAASVVVLLGWFVARIVRQIVTGLLIAAGADRLGERVGVKAADGGQTLSQIVGTVIYVLILIPALISGLEALQIDAVSQPASNMLNTLLGAIPAVFGAMIVLAITYVIGRLVAGLVTSLLTSIGFNRVLEMIGLGSEPGEGQRTPSEVVGYLVLVGLMLFAVIEAAGLMGFDIVAVLVAAVLSLAGRVVLGIIIFGLGLYLANIARDVVASTAGSRGVFLSQVARWAIILMAAAMALRATAIANDVVNLAFGLLLGAIAIAVALAFGLGAREVAAREVEGWLRQFRSADE